MFFVGFGLDCTVFLSSHSNSVGYSSFALVGWIALSHLWVGQEAREKVKGEGGKGEVKISAAEEWRRLQGLGWAAYGPGR